MNKYNNNFPGAPSGDSPMRFNKRFGKNNNGGKTSPRFKHQNRSSYKYSQNRNNALDGYQTNQYETTSSIRPLYGKKRQNHNHSHQNKPSSTYLQNSAIPVSPSPSTAQTTSCGVAKQSGLNMSPTTQSKSSAAQQCNQHQEQPKASNVLDNSNYYGFNYNFFPTYSANLLATSNSAASYSVSDGMNPYMWQTIMSTPPPKLPQKQQPPLPDQPPPELPPLPSSKNMPQLLPPPPIPASIIELTSPTTVTTSSGVDNNNYFNDKESAAKTIVKIKTKRKTMSARYKISKSWTEKDSLLALKAEETNARKLQNDIILIIRFPDPEISRDIVKCYSPDIESVHFQLNFAPRYCLVHLKPGTNVEKTIDHLSKIPFGTGFLSVEVKQIPHKAHSTKLNEIDPHTLYVGNLPTTIACKTLKEYFPGASRIDIGFAQRMKYTRYAFIRYQNVENAIEAYKRTLDAEIGGRTLTIRFRRLTPSSEGNKEEENETHDDISDDLSSQTNVPTENNISSLSEASTENIETISRLQDNDNVNTNPGDDVNVLPDTVDKELKETEQNVDNNNSVRQNSPLANNSIETNNSLTPLSPTIEEGNHCVSAKKSETRLNIKPEPDIDPDDIVNRNNAITSLFDQAAASSIKQEENNLDLYMEFFGKPNGCTQSTRSEVVSLPSTVDETDSISTASSNSLREFLQTCQKSQTQAKSTEESTGQPPTKRNKLTDADTLSKTIKREPLENNTATGEEELSHVVVTQEARTVKEEPLGHTEHRNSTNKNSSVKDSNAIQTYKNKRNPKTKRKHTGMPDNSENPNKDDLVPSTALFFRANKNPKNNNNNDSDYDEFYETRVSVNLTNVKREEPLYISARKSPKANNENVQQNPRAAEDNPINNEGSNVNSLTPFTTMAADTDDDDLVPTQNLLGSYHPPQNVFKSELDNDDIFSIPFNTTNHISEKAASDDNWDNTDSVTSFTLPSNNSENTSSETLARNVPHDKDDEDVIVISDNLRRQSTTPKSVRKLDSTNLFIPQQPDLVSFRPKPVSVTLPLREVSTLIHHDHLDRLYDQLDADSDTEL